jgi:hypothetical protein
MQRGKRVKVGGEEEREKENMITNHRCKGLYVNFILFIVRLFPRKRK